MVSINYATREVTCKIVYYGPGLSGKTTNLIYVHKKVPPTTRGKMISLATEADRTLYFDFLPINIGTINGFAAKFQLYTVPGQVYYNATRKLVLRGVDGLVFVADSQAEKMDENIESLTNLKENLEEYGYDLNELPIVIQYNKRDLPTALPVSELESRLNSHGWKCFEAEAPTGRGVFDTLKMIIKIVLEKAKTNKSSTAAPTKEKVEAATPAIAGVPTDDAVAATPEMSPAPVRQPAYNVEEEEENGNGYENGNGEAVEFNTMREERGGEVPSHPTGVGDGMEAFPPEPEAASVTAEASSRPFPGSTSARILRRGGRITVSDFQPAGRDAEQSALRGHISTENKVNEHLHSPSLRTPAMAPSQRLVRKKPGFFKRLFGIK